MATKLLYMDDFDVTTCDAVVTEMRNSDDGRTILVLDQTCFYPRGGGQDWDTGRITKNGAVYEVEEVRLDEDGNVLHICACDSGFAPGDAVHCEVDTERRAINTKLHSAGHLLDAAVDRLGYPWTPGKGSHYAHMSSVEYTGEYNPEQSEQMRQAIQDKIHELAAQGGQNQIRFMAVSDMHTVCRHVPSNIPANKPARVVVYCGDFGVPCGGTHVRDLAEIGEVTVTKINLKKGIIKVSYAVEGINA